MLANLIGVEATERLLAIAGGTRVSIHPRVSMLDTAIANAIGPAAALALCKNLSGMRLVLPKSDRRAAILRLRRRGLSIPQIARDLDVTERRIYQVLAEARV